MALTPCGLGMGTCAHLPIFLDDDEEKVLVCTMVLLPPSTRKGKRSRVRASAGRQDIGQGAVEGGMVVATGREEKVTAGQRDTQMKVRRESLRKSLRRWTGRQAQGDTRRPYSPSASQNWTPLWWCGPSVCHHLEGQGTRGRM